MVYLGQYVAGESMIHGLDPRVKIASVIGLSIVVLQGDILPQMVVTAFLIGLIPVSRFSPGQILKSLRPMMFFLGVLFLLHLFFTNGKAIRPFPLWHVTVTYEGVYMGVLISWRFGLLLTTASFLTLTTSPSELVSGIERILRPLKVFRLPSHDVAIMISIALRFLPTFLQEIERVREAQLARGANFKSGPLRRRIRAFQALVMPLIFDTLHGADDLAIAMESRGYRRGPRTYMKKLSLSRNDYVALGVMVLMITPLLI